MRQRKQTPSQREAARQRARRQTAHDTGRVRLAKLGDDYLLGIIAETCGLTSYVAQYMPTVQSRRDRRRAYNMGRGSASKCGLNDIADALHDIRARSAQAFDEEIRRNVPDRAEAIIAVAKRGPLPDPHIDEVRREAMSLLAAITPHRDTDYAHAATRTPRYGCAGI